MWEETSPWAFSLAQSPYTPKAPGKPRASQQLMAGLWLEKPRPMFPWWLMSGR